MSMSKKTVKWVATISVITLFVSGAISFLSEELLSSSGLIAAFFILLSIILVGIVFDVIGVAVLCQRAPLPFYGCPEGAWGAGGHPAAA